MISHILIRGARIDDAAAIAKVHVESWRTTYAGLIPADFLAALSCEGRERTWREHLVPKGGAQAVFVAETIEGEVVGFAAGGLEREGDLGYDGELYAIYLLKSYQRGGIGRRLFTSVADHLINHGCTSLLVWVLDENRARGFYESLGGTPVGRKPIMIGDAELQEIAYGWGDLNTLTAGGLQLLNG